MKFKPDNRDQIYDLDGPDIAKYQGLSGIVTDSCEKYDHFRQWVTWNGTKCSDYSLWYWYARWKCNTNYDLQVTYTNLGAGNPAFPTNAPVYVLKVELEFQNSKMSSGKLIDPLSPPRDMRVGVVQGDTVKFKSKLTPTACLQDSDYVWTGVQSGNGSEIDITFNSAGTFTEQLEVLECQACLARTTVVNVTGLGETAWMALHPQYWISAFELRDEALAWASNNQAALGGGLHNGRADAARHAYWNSIMIFDWNAADAEGLATAHEKTGLDDGDPHNETVMDLENNADGRGLVGANRVALQNAVINVLNAGTLTILDDLENASEVGLLQPSNQ
ncbi:DUF6973 domain-containing protein [Verrucomicrobiota bacterium]